MTEYETKLIENLIGTMENMSENIEKIYNQLNILSSKIQYIADVQEGRLHI